MDTSGSPDISAPEIIMSCELWIMNVALRSTLQIQNKIHIIAKSKLEPST